MLDGLSERQVVLIEREQEKSWRRWGLALFALAWFWLVALQVATGFLDQYLASNDTRRAGVVTIVDGVVDRFLVEPLGQPLAVGVLVALGGVFLLGSCFVAVRPRSEFGRLFEVRVRIELEKF